MSHSTEQNFGTLIAYVIPGWIVVVVVSAVSSDVLLTMSDKNCRNSVGGFLYSTATAVWVGLVLNATRMAIVDLVTKLVLPSSNRDYEGLQHNIDAIEFLVHNQFRYHQFYGNAALSMVIVLVALARHRMLDWTTSAGILAVIAILVYGSTKCLRVYYCRLNEILAESGRKSGRN